MTDSTDQLVEQVLGTGRLELPARLRDQILSAVSEVERPAARHFHLAQMNIAQFHAEMDDPMMVDFVAMLDPINHLSDTDPGCVWRLTGDGSNNATDIKFYDDPLMLVNMSVWTDLDSLRDFVYRTQHSAMLKRREEWAVRMKDRYMVMWWIPAGHRPDLAEGDARLKLLQANGPSADAFTFGQAFPAPD